MRTMALSTGLALLACTHAAAEENVQIYGTIDLGFSHRSNHLQQGIGSHNAIDSGASEGNRLGFRGTEDLGNGLKAFFTLEWGFLADTGVDNLSTSRQSFMGISGDFGTLSIGRQYSLHFILEATLDPFDANTVGNYRNLFQNIDAVTHGESLFDPTRIDNAIVYASPKFSGFNVSTMYAINALGNEGSLPETRGGAASVDNKADTRFFAIFPRYSNGPLDVGLLYHRMASDGYVANAQNPRISKWTVGAAYDFGTVKLSAFHDRNKLETDSPAKDGLTLRNWMIGAVVPFGKHAIQTSYGHSRLKNDGHTGIARQVALGYTYHFSKRTNFYAVVANIDNDQKRKHLLNGPAIAFDADNLGNGYQDSYQFGLLHRF
jgi:predicted porin